MPELEPQSISELPQVEQSPQFTRDETALRSLLGTDYEYARDSGLIDMFSFNPETGEDALLHILSGDIRGGENSVVPGGYHLESASRNPGTRVDRSHLEGRTNRENREFREKPWNPYTAITYVDGFLKTSSSVDSETGRAKPVKSGMYPKEYDALAVMQTIKQAMMNRNPEEDEEKGPHLFNKTQVPLLDGEHMMKVQLVIDKETGKVATAYPVVTRSRMKLTEKEVNEKLREHIVNVDKGDKT